MNMASHPQPILTPESAIGEAADGGMVEVVAKAIGAAMHSNPLSIETRRVLARAAIEALREPSADMRWAIAQTVCRNHPPASWRETGELHARLGAMGLATYCAMIDAALGKPA